MWLDFEWDSGKAESNWLKHGVTFREAASVLNDPLSVTMVDWEHSLEEVRYTDIGMSESGRILVVIYSEREKLVRLIGARRATRGERRLYEEGH